MKTNILDSYKKHFGAAREKVAGVIARTLMKYAKKNGSNSISWTQFTPYFNDGEPCFFRVYDLELEEGKYGNFSCLGLTQKINDDKYDPDSIEEVFRNVFGENAKVTISSNNDNEIKIEISSYEDHH